MEAEAPLEYGLLVKSEGWVYKIPPRPLGGHRAEDWKDCVWKGKVQVDAVDECVKIKLISDDGSLFAVCPVQALQLDEAVERTMDSSRFFALRLKDGTDRTAFVGLGFEDRTDAFDFHATLCDFVRRIAMEKERAEAPPPVEGDLSLKEGEEIRVNIKGLATKTRPARVEAQDNTGSVPLLPPPPAAPRAPRKPKAGG